MEMLQGVWKQHLRPRAVVGYGVKIFLPSPPNYVTRSPGYSKYCAVVAKRWTSFCLEKRNNLKGLHFIVSCIRFTIFTVKVIQEFVKCCATTSAG